MTAIVRLELGATLERTTQVSQLRGYLARAKAGGVTRKTALKWAMTAAREERLCGDNAKELAVLVRLPRGLRVELIPTMYTTLALPGCGLSGGSISPWALSEIGIAMWPAVFLPKQVRRHPASPPLCLLRLRPPSLPSLLPTPCGCARSRSSSSFR